MLQCHTFTIRFGINGCFIRILNGMAGISAVADALTTGLMAAKTSEWVEFALVWIHIVVLCGKSKWQIVLPIVHKWTRTSGLYSRRCYVSSTKRFGKSTYYLGVKHCLNGILPLCRVYSCGCQSQSLAHHDLWYDTWSILPLSFPCLNQRFSCQTLVHDACCPCYSSIRKKVSVIPTYIDAAVGIIESIRRKIHHIRDMTKSSGTEVTVLLMPRAVLPSDTILDRVRIWRYTMETSH